MQQSKLQGKSNTKTEELFSKDRILAALAALTTGAWGNPGLHELRYTMFKAFHREFMVRSRFATPVSLLS